MTDRTQHVLDAIDGALSDWSVSSDAMRWTPEPESRPKSNLMVRPTGLRFIPHADWQPLPPLDAEALADAFRRMAHSYAAGFDRMVIPIREFGRAVTAASNTLIPMLEQFSEDLDPELPPDRSDVRAHALWQVQHRNTGPQRPTAGRQKRPRLL